MAKKTIVIRAINVIDPKLKKPFEGRTVLGIKCSLESKFYRVFDVDFENGNSPDMDGIFCGDDMGVIFSDGFESGNVSAWSN